MSSFCTVNRAQTSQYILPLIQIIGTGKGIKMILWKRNSGNNGFNDIHDQDTGHGIWTGLTKKYRQRIQGCFEIKKNALTVALSLVCLDIRSRNEEAINSTRNRIYSLKVFHSLLLDIYFLFVSELIKYECYRRQEIRLRSQAIRVCKCTNIQGSRFQRNYIIARYQKSDLHGMSFQSSPSRK